MAYSSSLNPQWIHVSFVHEDVPGSERVVDAINAKDVHAFKKALEDFPLARTETRMDWNGRASKAGTEKGCSPARACVYMGWAGGIEALHEAGISFPPSLLKLAIKRRHASCVKKLLDIGVAPTTASGPAWLDIPYRNVMPETWDTNQRMMRAFLKQGANPWEMCLRDGKKSHGEWTALEERLSKGKLDIVLTALEHAVEKGQTYPNHATEFWVALTQCILKSASHPMASVLPLHWMWYEKIIEKAAQAGVPMAPGAPICLVENMEQLLKDDKPSSKHSARLITISSALARSMLEHLPDMQKTPALIEVGQHILAIEHIDPEERATWENLLLTHSTAQAPSARSNPRL